MKMRGMIFALAILAALLGALYWPNHHKPTETTQVSADTPPKILSLSESEVSRIAITKNGALEVALAKDNGQWQITSPERVGADQSAVSSMASTLSSLNAERVVDDKPDDLAPFGLNHPKLEVEVTGKNSSARKLLLGDDTPTGSGTYAKLDGDPRVFTIATYTKNSIDKNITDVRDKRLLPIDADRISRLELISNQQEMEFGRNKDQWQILKPKPLRADSYQLDELVRKLTDAKMELGGSDTKNDASAFAAGKSVATAKISTDSGTQELQIRKNNENYYAKSSAVRGIYKIGSDLGQRLDKKFDDFRNKKLFDFAYSDPERVEIRDGDKKYFLNKGGDDWWSGEGKKLDASSAESVIGKLRDLQATGFADAGFGNPILEVSISADSGKRADKVSISKPANDYLAKRGSEPELYVLDSQAVEDVRKAASDLKPATSGKK